MLIADPIIPSRNLRVLIIFPVKDALRSVPSHEGKKGKAEYLYSALHGTSILKRSDMDHTAFNL